MSFGLNGFGNFVSNSAVAVVQGAVNKYLNSKAASKQYDYTKSLIDYENEYNLPANQRARLEEAGYNPNLALNGVNVQSATGSAPQVKPTQLDLLSVYNLEAQYDLLKEQQKLTKATAVKNKADAGKIDEQTKTEELKNKKLAKDLQFYQDTGIDPDSWQGNSFKPIWNTAQKVANSDFINRIGGSYSDREWNYIMRNAREKFNKMRKK